MNFSRKYDIKVETVGAAKMDSLKTTLKLPDASSHERKITFFLFSQVILQLILILKGSHKKNIRNFNKCFYRTAEPDKVIHLKKYIIYFALELLSS